MSDYADPQIVDAGDEDFNNEFLCDELEAQSKLAEGMKLPEKKDGRAKMDSADIELNKAKEKQKENK
jgi:hypothetical protein